jgi:amino acid permease
MADFDGTESFLNNTENQFNSVGIARESEDTRRNTVSIVNFAQGINKPKRGLNQTINAHNKIAQNLAYDSQAEIDENNDAEPEDLNARDPNDMNKTLDDIFVLQIYGRRDPKEKTIPFESKNAKFFQRILHPMQYGSLRGSIFGLSSMCLEAGSMVLAIRCKQFGMINFLIFLILGGLVAYSCLVMMIKAGKSIKEKNYSKVVKTILGQKVGVFMDVNIALYLFGALISFQVIIYQMLGAVVYDILDMMGNIDKTEYPNYVKYKEEYWSQKLYLKFPLMIGVALLVFPLCLLKDISKMRLASLFGVLALVYSIIVVIIESFFYLFNENLSIVSKMNWIDIRPAFDINAGVPFFGGIATVFYIYSCHAGAFPVYKTLRNNTTKRIKKVFRRSILLDVMVYFTIAAASYITSPLEPPELILYRPNLSGFSPDYFILIAKIGIICNLFFSTPANYAGFRLSFFELVWGNTNITNLKNLCVTSGVLFVVVMIGALYDKILEYIELFGGFCSVIYCILIPGLIYVKNDNIKITTLNKYVIVGTVSILVIIGYTSGILTILFNMIKINGDMKEE